MSKLELLEKCKELNITKCNSKNKTQLIELINLKIKLEIMEEPKIDKLNVIDLFCGCGGMSKGLTDAGLNIIAGIDIWDKAVHSYNKNFEHKAYCEDLTNLSPEKFNELYNKENKNIDIIVGGPPCFIAGTKILTYSGYKNIEDVVLEDKLLTHTGNFQELVNLQHKIYTGDIYELKIKYHYNIIKCTEEHPFYVSEKYKIWDNSIKKYIIYFKEPIWKKAKELTNNDYFGMVINNNEIIPEFTFNKKIILDDPEYWYIMGYFIAETMNMQNSIKENIKFVSKLTYQKIKQSKFVWYKILKMFGKYPDEKKIPEWVQDAPKQFIQKFIDGYLKANNFIIKNGIIEITTISINLALGIQRLYLKLGHIVSITKHIYSKRYTYCIKNVLQKEKNISTFIKNNYVWYKPFKITKKYETNINVYNFEVSNDNSYIVENIIVHNCQSYSIAGKRDKNDPRNTLFMEYVKYLDYFKPKAFIMENVIGMLSKKTANGENVIDIIMEQLNKNHNCIINKLYASDFEVPQNRRRVIIIGIRKDLNIFPKQPELIIKSIKDRIPVKTVLIPKENIDKIYYLSEKALTGIKNKKKISKEKGFGFGAQMLDFDKPSYTIPARYWKDGYDALVKYNEEEIRKLTITELKRIQSFPDNYIIEGSNKDIIMQIGNAVACKFAYHLGNYIINILQ